MRTFLLHLAAPLLLAAGGPADASAGELWLINTRCVPSAACGQLGPIEFWQLQPDCTWLPLDESAFLALDPQVPTTVLIHGNRTDPVRALKIGWDVWQWLSCHSAGRPYRLVIWSWPSERIAGPRRDAQSKACRSDTEAILLANLLGRLPADARVNLFGFSFGARAATGALHLLAGGHLGGFALPPEAAVERLPMRAMLVAAAVDAHWLGPCGCHGLAMLGVEQAFITVNPCDRVLRLYRRMYGRRGPDALGLLGPAGYLAGAAVELTSVAPWVGRVHSWENYFAAPTVLARLLDYAWWDDAPIVEAAETDYGPVLPDAYLLPAAADD